MQSILDELAEVDREMQRTDTGDTTRLAESLERRGSLIRRAAQEIERLRKDGITVPHGTKGQLERSNQAGLTALRQVIQAKHVLATQLSQLRREQRMLDTLGGQGIEAGRAALDLRG